MAQVGIASPGNASMSAFSLYPSPALVLMPDSPNPPPPPPRFTSLSSGPAGGDNEERTSERHSTVHCFNSHIAARGSPHRRPKARAETSTTTGPKGNTSKSKRYAIGGFPSLSLAQRAAEEVLHKPLSESLQRLRRAQRAFIRRRRRGKVRVSFIHSTSSTRNSLRHLSRHMQHARDFCHVAAAAAGGGVGGAAVPAWHEIRTSLRRQPSDNGPYPLFGLFPPDSQSSSQQEPARCLGSPSKKRRAAKQRKAEIADPKTERIRAPPSQALESHPYWGTLPTSAAPSPNKAGGKKKGPDERQENVSSESVQADTSTVTVVRTQPHQHSFVSGSSHIAIKQRPMPGHARYSPFPKATQYPPITDKRRGPANAPLHLESVRRSLSQQRRLSSLMPSESLQSITSRRRPSDNTHPAAPLNTMPEEAASSSHVHIPSRSSSQIRDLDKFARELEKYAKITHAPGKRPVFTPTETETHVSLRTVQEFLPYREQFREAGLAVTSTDQMSPEKSVGKSKRPAIGGKRLSGDARLRFDGDGGVEAPKENRGVARGDLSADTAIYPGQADPISMLLVDEVPKKKTRDWRAGKKLLPWLRKKQAKPPPAAESSTPKPHPATSRGPRPIAFNHALALASKPLPYKPPSPRRMLQRTKAVSDALKKGKGHKSSADDGESTMPPPPPSPAPPPVPTPVDSSEPEPEERVCAPPPAPNPEPPSEPEHQVQPRVNLKQDPGPGPDPDPDRASDAVVTPRLSSEAPASSVHGLQKCLPALPRPRVPQNLRAALPSKASRDTTSRQLPTTIKEEKEPSPEKKTTRTPEKRKTPLQMLRAAHFSRDRDNAARSTDDKENFSAKRRSVPSKTPELPETWKNVVSTPSSFERALDDVIRKLDDMEDEKERSVAEAQRTRTISRLHSHPRMPSHSNRSPAKPPSPSIRRLQRAAALRRQRIAEATLRVSQCQIDPKLLTKPSDSAATSCSSHASVCCSRCGSASCSGTCSKSASASCSTATRAAPAAAGKGKEEAPSLNAEDRAGTATAAQDDRNISDRDVLRGLLMAVSAACDEDMDAWIRVKTGLRLRRFLADLKTFKNLSIGGAGGSSSSSNNNNNRIEEELRARRRRLSQKRLTMLREEYEREKKNEKGREEKEDEDEEREDEKGEKEETAAVRNKGKRKLVGKRGLNAHSWVRQVSVL